MKHEAFMLGTSKGKHLNTKFDLFITTAPIPDLNEKLIIFGQVVKGEDVVQVIEFESSVFPSRVSFFRVLCVLPFSCD